VPKRGRAGGGRMHVRQRLRGRAVRVARLPELLPGQGRVRGGRQKPEADVPMLARLDGDAVRTRPMLGRVPERGSLLAGRTRADGVPVRPRLSRGSVRVFDEPDGRALPTAVPESAAARQTQPGCQDDALPGRHSVHRRGGEGGPSNVQVRNDSSRVSCRIF